MADSTFDEILSEALLLAGDTTLTPRVAFALKKWLRSQATQFLWPQCKREASGIILAAGVQKLTLGNGAGGIAAEVNRINDPLKLYTGGFDTFVDVRIQTDWAPTGIQVDDKINNPASNTGAPSMARVRPSNAAVAIKNQWDVIFDRVADKQYLLEISFCCIPQDPTQFVAGVSAASTVWYPNDRTVVQAAYTMALQYKKDPEWRKELELTAHMVQQDRLSEGMKPGIYDQGIRLDTKVFR